MTLETKPFYRRLRRWQVITMVMLLAVIIRCWTAWQLPLDADEPVYSRAGQEYARLIKAGDLAGVLNSQTNKEHPPLVKLMYSLPYLFVEERFGSNVEMAINRAQSVLWGALGVLVLSLIDPLAGLLLALDSMAIKYTSEVYLESFPLFAGLLAIFAMRRFVRKEGGPGWFWVSAICLGAAAAGKYLYALLGVAILVLLWQARERSWRRLGGYALVALLAFLVLDPALWPNPPARLWESLTFHWTYSQGSADVVRANYPWYQAFNWITAMVPWHPQVFFFPTPDVLIFLFALVGIAVEWRKEKVWAVIWALVVFAVLLAWPTKWPQYTLMLIPALCLLGASGLRWVAVKARDFAEEWNLVEGVLPHPGKVFWVSLVLVLLGLVGLKVGYEIKMAQARAGWSTLQPGISPLPGNSVNALASSADGTMWIATNAGLAIWQPTEKSPWGNAPRLLTHQNSGLPSDAVLALISDRNGGWWLGTEGGLAHWDGAEVWKVVTAAEMGLPGTPIQHLLLDTAGRLWVGTPAGVVTYSAGKWERVQGLPEQSVFCLAEEHTPGGSAIWFCGLKGASRLDVASGNWQTFDLSKYGLGWAGVADIYAGDKGQVWVATQGDGISSWDGKEWTTMRASNSQIPLNSVVRLMPDGLGGLWAGFNYASNPGGMLAHFNGKDWTTYSNANSGFGGAEPLALALDRKGWLWIGTAVDGLQIFQVAREGVNP